MARIDELAKNWVDETFETLWRNWVNKHPAAVPADDVERELFRLAFDAGVNEAFRFMIDERYSAATKRPEELASTVNSESPEDETGQKAEN